MWVAMRYQSQLSALEWERQAVESKFHARNPTLEVPGIETSCVLESCMIGRRNQYILKSMCPLNSVHNNFRFYRNIFLYDTSKFEEVSIQVTQTVEYINLDVMMIRVSIQSIFHMTIVTILALFQHSTKCISRRISVFRIFLLPRVPQSHHGTINYQGDFYQEKKKSDIQCALTNPQPCLLQLCYGCISLCYK